MGLQYGGLPDFGRDNRPRRAGNALHLRSRYSCPVLWFLYEA